MDKQSTSYATLESRTKRIHPVGWRFHRDRMTFSGPEVGAVAGKVHQVVLDLDFPYPDDLYEFARTLTDYGLYLQDVAGREMDEDAQAQLELP